MKKLRKALFIAVMAVVVAVTGAFFVACNDKKPDNTEYTLTFMVGTVPYETVTGVEGSEVKLTKPDPTRAGYTFDGWSLTDNGAVVEIPSKMPAQNITYRAVFSARYDITLNAGIGSIGDGQTTISAKAGDNLYSLVSDITPSVTGDAEFDAWFYGSTKLDAQSSAVMPAGNITLTAKYKVDYQITVYKQTVYEGNDYEAESKIESGSGYVGEIIPSVPSRDGYRFNGEKDSDATKRALSAVKSENVFNAYYDLVGFSVVFNANLPSDVEYAGSMETVTCGYGMEYPVPQCEYTADGYRFDGWATTANGNVAYRYGVGEDGKPLTYSVTRVTTLYAKWVKGLTDILGRSHDRIYVMDNATGTDKIVYLERFGLDDILGEYDKTTDIFTFKNSNALTPTGALLRGVADVEHGTFAYLDTNKITEYKLLDIFGNVSNTAKLLLNDDGTAVYTDNGASVNGAYSFDGTAGSMKFTSQSKNFYFRLSNEKENGAVFSIRGEEYGSWNNLNQAGVVDAVYRMELDGYGRATMYVTGYSSDLTKVVTSSFIGKYVYSTGENAYVGEAGKEVVVTLLNNSMLVRSFACLLMTGEYHADDKDQTEYTHVYLQQFALTMYGKPQAGAELDKENADKIVLGGYNIFDDGATYTYDDNGVKRTVNGTYEYDDGVGTLRISPKNGDDLLFEVRMSSSEEDAVPLFEPVETLFGQYSMTGLLPSTSANNLDSLYKFHVYNNGQAAFAFLLPISDGFYGNVAIEYFRTIYGTYEVSDDSSSDVREWEYEFKAKIDNQTIISMYVTYSYLVNASVDIRQFGSFKFKFVYDSADADKIVGCNVTQRGDFAKDITLEYDGNVYTLDGFGKATAQIQVGDEIKVDVKDYSFKTLYGMQVLVLSWETGEKDENNKDIVEQIVYFDVKDDGKYVEIDRFQAIYNSINNITLMLMKDGTVGVMLVAQSGMSVSMHTISYGTIAWDEGNRSGVFTRAGTVDNDALVGLNKEYVNFKFVLVTVGEGDKEHDEMYIYDVNMTPVENKIELTSGDDSLTIDLIDSQAVYVEKVDGKTETYSGDFYYTNGVLTVVQTNADKTVTRVSLKLEYTNGQIASFTRVNAEVGNWLYMGDAKSYIYLSGAQTVNDGEYSATYYEYTGDDENGAPQYSEHAGTYKATTLEDVSGYDFFVTGDPVDEEGNAVARFTFGLAYDAAGIRIYQTYAIPVSMYVYYMPSGSPVRLGTLTGGGFDAHVLTIGETKLGGLFEYTGKGGVWSFTASSSKDVYYFAILVSDGNPMPILLDSTFGAPNYGVFEIETELKVTVPEHEIEKDDGEGGTTTETVPEKEITVTSIESTGMGIAYLHYVGEDPDNPDKVTGMYVAVASGTYAFALFVETEDGMIPILFRFKLAVKEGDEELGEADKYIAILADKQLFGTFECGDDLTAVSLDGFGNAYYVDENGVLYSGMFGKLKDHPEVVQIVYLDIYAFEYKVVYIEVDAENGTFTKLDENDDRIPVTPDNGEGGETEQLALAA